MFVDGHCCPLIETKLLRNVIAQLHSVIKNRQEKWLALQC